MGVLIEAVDVDGDDLSQGDDLRHEPLTEFAIDDEHDSVVFAERVNVAKTVLRVLEGLEVIDRLAEFLLCLDILR